MVIVPLECVYTIKHTTAWLWNVVLESANKLYLLDPGSPRTSVWGGNLGFGGFYLNW